MVPQPRLTRRGLLAAGGAVIVGAASSSCRSPSETTTTSSRAIVPFDGDHQPGIVTPAPLLTTFIGMNMLASSREDLLGLLVLVSDDARRLMAGQPALADTEPENATEPESLTIAVGFGRPLFTRLRLPIPANLPEIPGFKTDALQPRWGQTDLVVQIGSDSPLALQHAHRMISKDTSPLAETVWIQDGFRGALVDGGDSMRNLMGQVDGTVNPRSSGEFDDVVWIDRGPDWMRGGTVLVLRRIRMLLDSWDVLDSAGKEMIAGRTLDTGAPLGGTNEHDPVDLEAVDSQGFPIIPSQSHVAVARQGGERILRRPFNYTEHGADGTTEAGQLFAAYMKDPATSFIPLQDRISRLDTMNLWVEPVGSAAYIYPRGCRPDGYLAEGLFEA